MSKMFASYVKKALDVVLFVWLGWTYFEPLPFGRLVAEIRNDYSNLFLAQVTSSTWLNKWPSFC